MAVSVRECSTRLQALPSEDRKKILLDIADALEENDDLIKVENDADIAVALNAGYERAILSRLALKPRKISSLAKSIRKLADMEEPIGHVIKRTEAVMIFGLLFNSSSDCLVKENRKTYLIYLSNMCDDFRK